jgi:hypothetical protein
MKIGAARRAALTQSRLIFRSSTLPYRRTRVRNLTESGGWAVDDSGGDVRRGMCTQRRPGHAVIPLNALRSESPARSSRPVPQLPRA